jgi:hypothetical protein
MLERIATHLPSPSLGHRARAWRLELAGFALLLIAEFLAFDLVGAKHQTWIYPRWNDQIQYLTEAYLRFEQLRLHGLGSALWQSLTSRAAQGALHSFFAVLAFTVAGPSRSAALAINAIAFLTWQTALFLAVRRAFGSRPLAWTGAGLLLALASPWTVQQGSAFDFRLDWMAASALGVTLAVALGTEGFRRLGPSLLFGGAVGITLLTRFLTGSYLALIFAALLVWILAGAERRRRVRHLLSAAAIAGLVAGPTFWTNRRTILDYYWIGHFFGPESSIRDSGLGPGASLAWLVRNLGTRQLGLFWVAWVLAVSCLLAGALVLFRRSLPVASAPPRRHAAGVLGAIFLLAPALVLVAQPEKSFVVLSALLPGAVVAVLAGWHRLLRHAPRRLPAAVAAATLLAGAGFFAVHMGRNPNSPEFEAGARQVLALSNLIYDRARAAGLTAPRIGCDQVTDCLDAQVLRVICYERKHVWLPFQMTMPLGIAQAPEALIMERLENTDFMYITVAGPMIGYPWDRELRALVPTTKSWCDAHMRKIDEFDLFGQHIILYQRIDSSPQK